MIGRDGERRSGISAQAARHDDDMNKSDKMNRITSFILITFWLFSTKFDLRSSSEENFLLKEKYYFKVLQIVFKRLYTR